MSVLLKVIITEKAERIKEQQNKYTFIVDPKANKAQIKQAIEQMYGVNVTAISTQIYAPKKAPRNNAGFKRYDIGWTNKYKKAIVDLKEGQTIDILE